MVLLFASMVFPNIAVGLVMDQNSASTVSEKLIANDVVGWHSVNIKSKNDTARYKFIAINPS